jgi:hypothetical protein
MMLLLADTHAEGALDRKGVSVEWNRLKKFPETWSVRPNLLDYGYLGTMERTGCEFCESI